ncbi:MAG: PEP-CTERM sorting domain-containing protein, partial [Isosphaeraceae bacterium]
MHRIQGRTGLRAAVIALGLVAWTATAAMASPLTYSTSGQINATGVSPSDAAVISFVPLTGNTVDLASGQTNVSLGNFVVSSPGSASTTYTDTPFQISFLPQSYNHEAVNNDPQNPNVVQLTGKLNGVVSGPSSSTVIARFDPISDPHFSLGAAGTANLNLPTGSLLLAPSTS